MCCGTTDTVAVKKSNSVSQRIQLCSGLQTIIASYLFAKINEKKKKSAFTFQATKTKQLTWCQRKFLLVTNCQEKEGAGHVYLIRIVSNTNTVTADVEICAVCTQSANLTKRTYLSPALEYQAQVSLSPFNAQFTLHVQM